MKRKIWSMLICIMLLCMGGCSVMIEDIKNDLEWAKENQIAGEHYNEAAVDALLDILGDESGASQSASIENSNKKCSIGEWVDMETTDGEKVRVCVTDWGNTYDVLYGNLMYMRYEIENIGNVPVTVGNGMFNVYADDYVMQQFLLADDVIGAAEISSGRKLGGTVYVEGNSDFIGKLEVECGNVIWTMKEPDETADTGPWTIEEGQPLESWMLAGEYSSIGDGYAALNMYSSFDDEYVGNICIEYDWELSGKLLRSSENVFQIINSDEIDAYMDVFIDNGNATFDLYINGEFMDSFIMFQPYIS